MVHRLVHACARMIYNVLTYCAWLKLVQKPGGKAGELLGGISCYSFQKYFSGKLFNVLYSHAESTKKVL